MRIFKVLISFIFVLVLTPALLFADVAKVAGGAMSAAYGYAAYSAASGTTLSKCCSASMGTGANCCVMAVSAFASAASLFDDAGDAGSIQNQAQCEELMGAAFCSNGFTMPEFPQLPEIPTYTYPDGTTEVATVETQKEPNYGTPLTFSSYEDYRSKMTNSSRQGAAIARKSLSQLATAGYTVSSDGKTISMPDGKTVSISSLGSAEGLAAAGFSKAEIAQVNNAIKEVNKKNINNLIKKQLQLAGAYAGGTGGRRAAVGRTFQAPKGPDLNKMFDHLMGKGKRGGKTQARGTASFQGISKTVGNGDRIGVAADNIFDMVHRKYIKEQHSLYP